MLGLTPRPIRRLPAHTSLSVVAVASVVVAAALGACSDKPSNSSMNDDDAASDGGTPPEFEGQACEQLSGGELFEQRIEPLMAEDRPKTCNQCHLSGIDLGTFIRDTPCETMACLVDQGMVDLKDPETSKILSWIERADPESPLITQEVIDEEYEGFLSWIQFNAACGAEECADVTCEPPSSEPFCNTQDEPTYEDAVDATSVDTECSDLAIEQLFRDTIYRSRGRCYTCHFDFAAGEILGDPTPWIRTDGSCNEASLATLREIERRGYIDVDEPEKSLLLLKPLAEEEGGLEHGGGEKFHSDEDSAYLNFSTFIERYASCKRDE